jgi:hypothetical protein
MTTANLPAPRLRIGIIVLTVATAAVHLYLGVQGLPLFVLNGLGYLTLLAALYLPVPQLVPYRNLIRWALVGFTLLTIVLWLFITGGASTAVGYLDKTIEVLLVFMLLAEARAARQG